MKSRTLILSVALFLTLATNGAFFKHVLEVYPWTLHTAPMIISLGVVLMGAIVILLTLFSSRYLLKPFLITVLLLSSLVTYFMNSYDIIVDTHMIENILQTNIHESSDLLSIKQVLYFLILGVIPSIVVYRVKIAKTTFKSTVIESLQNILVALGVMAILIFSFSKFYTSFFREHKPLRYYTNPTFYLYTIGQYVHQSFSHKMSGLQQLGMDAKVNDSTHRKLVVLVVGEAVRWDHFSLNGYTRETNPLLKKEDIINFTEFTSCGTETAVSVPCMFSSLGRADYDKDVAEHTENVLDVLKHAGTNILWRDNNSDSKGVALRVAYEDYKLPANNTVCEDGECRDEGMLVGLQEYINAHPKGNIVIVLHQMGNHGPAYYKRYPKEYEKFTPVCQTNQLEQCSQAEITNAYDNTILYTDTFISKVIGMLKQNDETFATAMFYLSDHGESLGENGLYLHGFPYNIAPEAQKHVPAVMWFGKNYTINKTLLRERSKTSYSQDFLFHTMLGLSDVNTSVYKPELDIVHGIH
ncbi:MAG: phosphoethanolamine--lipid A transferase [Sulfuricurvum sp.]|uniref:phosphoethanolamine transferase n=1 Tax=Sulfuricurvum sp. TaxID=2025608 RepID=UPI00262F7FFB|nr:phosphoethanolamine--lipid A transferase [Sulfuricurvum sp.]MDD2828017.1 phosphoethanolamine--lipid A transferase [Sulfuricurvum sp.]MDD4948106.1 phosphoethanolamine--lipid A transferase [Sulfuricurvum sp.]